MMKCLICNLRIQEGEEGDKFVSFISLKERKEILICNRCWKDLLESQEKDAKNNRRK